MPIDPAWLEVRSIKDEKIQFLVVDAPEKWEAASDIQQTFEMTIPGANKKIAMDCKGISFDDFTKVAINYPLPEWEGDGDVPKEIVAAREDAALQRRIGWMELATGMTIGGKTLAEKRDYINRSNPANIEILSMFIRRELCNGEGYQGILLATWNELERRFPEEKIVKVNSFESFLAESTDVIHKFRMNRHGQQYIVEIPLKGLTSEVKEKIEKATVDPIPPMMPAFHPITKQPIPGKTTYNKNDSSYLRAVNYNDKKRVLLYLQACLQFAIPGKNEEEQIAWIGQRLVGDIRQVNIYINNIIIGMEGRYNFFWTA